MSSDEFIVLSSYQLFYAWSGSATSSRWCGSRASCQADTGKWSRTSEMSPRRKRKWSWMPQVSPRRRRMPKVSLRRTIANQQSISKSLTSHVFFVHNLDTSLHLFSWIRHQTIFKCIRNTIKTYGQEIREGAGRLVKTWLGHFGIVSACIVSSSKGISRQACFLLHYCLDRMCSMFHFFESAQRGFCKDSSDDANWFDHEFGKNKRDFFNQL